MKTVRLGKTGLQVSRVGMGGIPILRPTEAEAIRVIQRALDLGVNFIDTSRVYWSSKERIGKVRHIGMSSHSSEVAQRAIASGHIETIQFPLNFVAREPAQKLMPGSTTWALSP